MEENDMELAQIASLSVLQGITEFLPVSSSAHLILLPYLAQWADQGLGFDLAVHLGTLLAVLVYFRDELKVMAQDWTRSLATRQTTGDSRLAWAVLWGTVPVGLAGLVFENTVEQHLRSPQVIILTTIGFGLLLWWADSSRHGQRSEHQLVWKDILLIGCAQALALIPGTSRSGATITAGLLCGLSREGAARFSFLLAIPVTALAGALKMLELATNGQRVDWVSFLIGGVLSALTAFVCIHFFLKLLARFGMMPYVLYRMLLGGVLFMLYGL